MLIIIMNISIISTIKNNWFLNNIKWINDIMIMVTLIHNIIISIAIIIMIIVTI